MLYLSSRIVQQHMFKVLKKKQVQQWNPQPADSDHGTQNRSHPVDLITMFNVFCILQVS